MPSRQWWSMFATYMVWRRLRRCRRIVTCNLPTTGVNSPVTLRIRALLFRMGSISRPLRTTFGWTMECVAPVSMSSRV